MPRTCGETRRCITQAIGGEARPCTSPACRATSPSLRRCSPPGPASQLSTRGDRRLATRQGPTDVRPTQHPQDATEVGRTQVSCVATPRISPEHVSLSRFRAFFASPASEAQSYGHGGEQRNAAVQDVGVNLFGVVNGKIHWILFEGEFQMNGWEKSCPRHLQLWCFGSTFWSLVLMFLC